MSSKPSRDVRERAYRFSLEIIRSLKRLPNERACWIISDQVLRSSMSIGANATEAQGASSRLEFKRFFEIALKSARETKYWLFLLKDAGYLQNSVADVLLNELNEITAMLVSAVKRLKSIPPTSGI
ncbi:MAG: four helix bundle protein [Patescibacteria group bacterium]